MVGTADNDTFNAVLQANGATGTTVAPGDVINGGAGTDTLSISVAGLLLTTGHTLSAVQTNSVEKVLLNNYDTDATLNNTVDTVLMNGLTTVGLSASAAEGDTIFSNMTAIVAAEMRNGAADLTLTYGAAAVAGAADTQALTVSGVTAGTFTANGTETIAITTGLVKSTVTNVVSDKLKTVTASGDAALTISTALTATTINAAAMTGALNVTLGAAAQAVTGGAGADVIDASTQLANDDVIVGGAGVDTLKLSTAAAVAVGTAAAKGALYGVSGVEVIDVASTNDAAAVSLDATVGVTTVVAAANVGVFGVDGTTETTGDTVTFVLNGVSYTSGAVTTTTAAVATYELVVAAKINLITGFTAVAGTNLVTITNTSGASESVEFGGLAITGTGTVAVTGTTGYTNVSFTNLAAGQVVDIYSADAVSAGLKDASGTADALSINLKTTASDKGFAKAVGTVTASNIETINLSANGMTDGKVTTIAALTGNAMKTLNITGDSDVTISAFTSSAVLATIDGSTASGDISVVGIALAQSIKTGSGNDTIIMGSTLGATDTIDGGANNTFTGAAAIGKDTLTASGDLGTVTAVAALKIANVETIEISNTGAAATYIDAAGITGAESIAFSATSGTVQLTNLAAGTKIGVGIGAAEMVGTLDLTLADATGAADAITLAYSAKVDTSATTVVKVASAVETLNIAATVEAGTTGTVQTITNTDMAAKNIVVTSGHAADTLALGTLNAATTNVNASAYAGILTMTGAAATAMAVSANGAVANSITTGTGVDTITLAGKLGIAINTINGGTGTSVDVLNATADNAATDFTSVSNIETINLTISASSTVGIGDTTAKMTGINAATNINLLGGDVLSKFSNGTTGVITDSEKVIDATGFAGAIDLVLTANALDADMTIKGGALLTDKVTTAVSTATTGEVVKLMSGVETLVLNSVTTVSNARIDLTNVSGLVNLEANFVTGGTLSQIAVDKLMSGVAIKATGTVTNDNLVIDLAGKAAADNALSLEIGGVAVANDILNIDAAGVETLNIKASNTLAATLDLAGVAATGTGTVTVNVTGAGGVIFKTLSLLTNVVNASTATGAITLASADRAATAMTITTGTGADTVAMRHVNDVLNGGLGTDTLVLTPNFVLGGVLIDLNSATDQITTFNGSANAAVQIGFENVDLSGVTGTFGADITAKSTGSTITGTANADVILGGAGVDTFIVNAGTVANSDVITGGASTDILQIATGLTYTQATDTSLVTVETINLIGTASVVLTGQTEAFTINGGTGVNTITGGDAADIITGGDGADAMNGGTGADKFVFSALTATESGSALGATATTAPVTTTADAITGFVTTSDKISIALALGAAGATNGLVATGATAYTAASTGLVAADFLAVNIGGGAGSMTAVTANATAGGRFLYDNTNGVLYYDAAGDSAISTAGAYTAGAVDDFVVLKIGTTSATNTIVAGDFIFA